MLRMVSTYRLVIGLCIIFALVGIAYIVERPSHVSMVYAEATTIAAGDPTFDDVLKRFSDLAEEKGSEYAFGVLRTAELRADTDIHLIAHEIGHVLYTESGIDGMSVCTQEFRNGCSHALVIEAMQELGDGDDVRRLIDEACLRAPGGGGAYTMCYHGLGHGVFAYYGFSFPKTIEFCNKTGTEPYRNKQAHECIGGAVMELVSGGGHDKEKWTEATKKYLNPEDALAPCNTDVIPKDSKPLCYVYLTPHYLAYVGATLQTYTRDQLIRAMALCTALPFGVDRNACIGGFGKDFANMVGEHDVRLLDEGRYTDDQLRQVEMLCRHTREERDIQTCASYALSTFFWGGAAKPGLAERFCTILSNKAAQDACFHDLAASISRFIADNGDRMKRCAGLPLEHRSECRDYKGV